MNHIWSLVRQKNTAFQKFHFIYCPAGEKEGGLHGKHLDALLYYNFDSEVLSSEKSSTILHIAQ